MLSVLGTFLQVSHPDSLQARAIFDLGVEAGLVFAAAFALAAEIIVYGLMRFRWSESEPDPRRLEGNRAVEKKEHMKCRIPAMVPCFVPGRSYCVSNFTTRRMTFPPHLAGKAAGGMRSRTWLSAVSFAP